MSVGKTIKNIRELRNYTQAYVAEQLGISVSGYGKIERDETDITLSRLKQIAQILDTQMEQILDFNPGHIFNQYNNKLANGIVQNQQIISDTFIHQKLENIQKEVRELREKLLTQNKEKC